MASKASPNSWLAWLKRASTWFSPLELLLDWWITLRSAAPSVTKPAGTTLPTLRPTSEPAPPSKRFSLYARLSGEHSVQPVYGPAQLEAKLVELQQAMSNNSELGKFVYDTYTAGGEVKEEEVFQTDYRRLLHIFTKAAEFKRTPPQHSQSYQVLIDFIDQYKAPIENAGSWGAYNKRQPTQWEMWAPGGNPPANLVPEPAEYAAASAS